MKTFPDDEIQELKAFGEVSTGTEGGFVFFRVAGLVLPDGCTPDTTTALVCPHERDGYKSRLFFSEPITSPAIGLNWNGQNVRILEQNWFAFSLTVRDGLRLGQIVNGPKSS